MLRPRSNTQNRPQTKKREGKTRRPRPENLLRCSGVGKIGFFFHFLFGMQLVPTYLRCEPAAGKPSWWWCGGGGWLADVYRSADMAAGSRNGRL